MELKINKENGINIYIITYKIQDHRIQETSGCLKSSL